MTLQNRIQQDMVAAMKAREEIRLSALRMVKTALLKYKADHMKEADEAAEIQLLSSLVKQRKEAIEQFRAAGREELAQREEQELAILESYLPAQATADEIESAIRQAFAETGVTSLKQMGVIMKAVQARLAGKRIDGKALSDAIRARLSAETR